MSDQMKFMVDQGKPQVSQSDHPTAMGYSAGQQGSSAGGTGRGAAIGLSEQRSLIGESLEIWILHSIPIGLYASPHIMGMDIEDIQLVLHFYLHTQTPAAFSKPPV
jgi:hypothetical protein